MGNFNCSASPFVAALTISLLGVSLGDGCADPHFEQGLESGPGVGDAGVSDTTTAKSVAWSLTTAQRRALLEYYSPLLMLRTHEPNGEGGDGWITNFDFDRDGMFDTNKHSWEDLSDYLRGTTSTAQWQIRPTLYTSLIEFMEPGGSKSAILIYHVYHAKQPNAIHDWERIEIRVNDISGTPGTLAERVRYVAITTHYTHQYRLNSGLGLNFYRTPSGNHVMIWQAQSGIPIGSSRERAELQFVEDSFAEVSARVAANQGAEVHLSSGGERVNVHYVFTPRTDSHANAYWNASTLSRSTADSLASRKRWSNTVSWSAVPRIRYELQDIADILPTHWADGNNEDNWGGPSVDILLNNPILSESGVVEVPIGRQTFYYGDLFARPHVLDQDREGYPKKSWLWGVYNLGGGAIYDEMFEGDSAYPSRATASGWRISLNSFWWQHDYYAHDGVHARWLVGNWYQPAVGGFDGRWVQLFPD